MTDDLGVRHPGPREAAAAIAVAGLVVLVSWLTSEFGGGNESPRADLAASPSADVRSIDVSGEVTEADIAACLSRPFALSVDDVTVLYSTVQQVEDGTSPVMVLRNESGELRLCDSFGGDAPSVAPIEYADAKHPVQYLSNGRMAWRCDGTKLTAFRVTHWYSVDDVVDRAELRFIIDGVEGPWFSAQPENGFVHVHGWLSEQQDGAKVQVQSRLLDAQGGTVAQSKVPTTPQPVNDCDGHDIEIL